MRAPPPPRRSKSRFLAHCVVQLRQLISCYRLRKRWHLHKLHKIHRTGGAAVSPISGIHAEDMMNMPTALQPRNSRKKPLLIAEFPKGCSRSPRVRVLQRNRLSKLMISKRKYKLKSFDVDGARKLTVQEAVTHQCANTVGSIKKMTSRNADVRVIYHETNVIKCSKLDFSTINSQSPELFEFAPNRSIRIKDYPSLKRNAAAGLQVMKNKTQELSEDTAQNYASKFERLTLSNHRHNSSGKIIKVSEFPEAPLISYSRLVPTVVAENTSSRFYKLNQKV